MSRILVASVEASKPLDGRWFGYEVFDVDGDFTFVVHTSTYDGIKRDSHWAEPEQKLDALTKDTAIIEASRKTIAYARAVTGQESP